MHKRWLCVLTLFVGGAFVLPVAAQQTVAPVDEPAATPAAAPDSTSAAPPAAQPQDASAPAQTPAAAPTWSVGPVDFAGTIDGYYGFNFNHPILNTGANGGQVNYLYNFNAPANQFSLNMVKLGMSHTADPVGFEFDLMYGNTDAFIQPASTSGFDQYVENAYVTFKPAKAHGFEMDFGKFTTTAGAEVIESYSNWNYSRSLLFSWAIPYYHFGLRTSFPLGKHWTGGVQVVNGWNNTLDNNSGKTVGLNLTAAYAKWGWVIDWYGGPENPGTNSGWKNLYDTTLTLTPSSKFAMYINYDYGEQKEFNQGFNVSQGGPYNDGFIGTWQGLGESMHFQLNSKWSFTPRFEWFDDPEGVAMYGAGAQATNAFGATPVRQSVKEGTLTLEYKFLEGLMWRGEYRYDWSNQPFFLVGAQCNATFSSCLPGTASGLGNSDHQNTLTFAVIAFFGPKR